MHRSSPAPFPFSNLQWGPAPDPCLNLSGAIPPQDDLGRRPVDAAAASLPLCTLRIDGLLRYSISHHIGGLLAPSPSHSSRPDPSTGPEIPHSRNPGRRAVGHVPFLTTHQPDSPHPTRGKGCLSSILSFVSPNPWLSPHEAITFCCLCDGQRRPLGEGPHNPTSASEGYLSLWHSSTFCLCPHGGIISPGTGNTDVQAWYCEKRSIPARRAQTAATRLVSFGLFHFIYSIWLGGRRGHRTEIAPRFVRVTNRAPLEL